MKTHVNLLPIAYRRKQLLWLRSKQWTAIAGVALAAAAMACWVQLTRNHRDQLRLESLRREYLDVKETADKVELLKKEIDDLRQKEAIVLSLADEQPMLTLVGIVSQATRQCEGGLCVQRMQLQRRTEGEGKFNIRVLTLEGIAADNHLVARFAAALRDSEAFARVELKSSGRRIVQDAEGQAYSLECVY